MRTSAVRSRLLANPMEEPPTEEKVIQALNVVYAHVSSQEQRDQAENWLVSYRRTDEAWEISINLLRSNNIAVAHFAAHSIQEKIKNQWHSLPPENQKSVFDILMTYFRTWSDGPNLLLTRIALALSQIAIHVFPLQYPTFIDDLLSLLDQKSEKEMTNAVLTLFRVLPEELEDAIITEEKRSCVTRAVRAEAPKIIPLLVKYLDVNHGSEELKLSALKCLTNWKISTIQLIQTPILEYVFECIRNYDSVVECAMEYLIAQLESTTIRNYPNIRFAFLKKFVSLEERFVRSVQENNHAIAYSMTRMFTDVGDLLCDVITVDKDAGPKLAMILARCGSHPDRDISSVSFRFWLELQTHLNDLEPESEQREWFIAPFLTMVRVLRDQCVYPDTSDWTTEQYQNFATYRADAADTMINCYEFLKSKCHEVLWILLNNDLKQQNSQQWTLIEATIFFLKATSEVVDKDDKYIPLVLAAFPSFPVHTNLFQTALQFLGEISDRWLCKKEPSRFIPMVLQYVTQGLLRDQPAEVGAAAQALNQVCRTCSKYLLPYIDNIAKVVEPILLQQHQVDVKVKCLLLQALVQIVNEYTIGEACPLFWRLTNPIIERINSLIITQQTPEIKMAILAELSLFAHSCMLDIKSGESCKETESTNQQKLSDHPLLQPLNSLWPIIVKILQIYNLHDDVVDAVMKILKYAIGNINAELFYPLVPSFLEIICACYKSNPNEQILKTFSISITVYSNTINRRKKKVLNEYEHSKNQHFNKAIISLATDTFTLMSKEINAWPAIVKQFFEVLSHMLKGLPDALLGPTTGPSESASRIDFFSVAICALPHVVDRLAHKSIVNFIKGLLSSSHQQCVQIITKNFRPLLEMTYQAISNHQISRSMIPTYGGILMTLRDFHPNELRMGTIELFVSPSFPSSTATPEIKQQFLKDLFNWKTKEFNDKLHSFAVICRGLDLRFGIVSKPFV